MPLESLKLRRPRTRGQRLVKKKFVVYLRISQMSSSVQCAYWSQNFLKRICNASVFFQIKVRKISRRRSPTYAELCHFTLLLCIAQQRNVYIFNVHSLCSVH